MELEDVHLKKLLANDELDEAILRVWRGNLLMLEDSRRTVEALRTMFPVSERFTCNVVSKHHSTQRHPPKLILIEEGNSGIVSVRSPLSTSCPTTI